MAAVHYPVWIDSYAATSKQRTMWIGGYNVALLSGILIGYGIGAGASSLGVSWRVLYAIEAVLMAICGLLTASFSRELLQVSRAPGLDGAPESKSTALESHKPIVNADATSLRDVATRVFASKVYIWTVATGALIAGTVCFILYFVNQYLDKLHIWDETTVFVLTGIIFIAAPIPGNLVGAWYVSRNGGYENAKFSTGSTFVASIFAFFGTIVLALSAGAQSGFLVIFGFYSLLFFGSLPTASVNGIAVSITSKGTVVGSGIQYAISNMGKVVIPPIGGALIDQIGITRGFEITLCIGSFAAIATAFLGYRAAEGGIDLSRYCKTTEKMKLSGVITEDAIQIS
eukprot:CAMPEP_0185775772 /NCGR_PEP_ID=MMETSP1174-20130828/83250_1 /TAXON_ID=35687 /ORGANISM="Dictyocha speculum, Strain CCMP1381" /LENGTH=342 /DNA_ID=CAMNT_0028463453 /DNA_START=506 /DNA_END=1534 /DNA_ORIENTATION=-